MKELNMRELCISNPMAARRLQNLCKKLEAAYPDKKVSGLGSQHNHWYEDLSALVKELGYTDRAELLAACGFEYVKSLGGRPSDTSDNYLNELKKRYPNGASFASLTELVAANPDLAGKTKTMTNTAQKLYGMSLSNYLAENGLMQGKQAILEQRKTEALEKKLTTLDKIEAQRQARIALEERRRAIAIEEDADIVFERHGFVIDTAFGSLTNIIITEIRRCHGRVYTHFSDKVSYFVISENKKVDPILFNEYDKVTTNTGAQVHVISLQQLQRAWYAYNRDHNLRAGYYKDNFFLTAWEKGAEPRDPSTVYTQEQLALINAAAAQRSADYVHPASALDILLDRHTPIQIKDVRFIWTSFSCTSIVKEHIDKSITDMGGVWEQNKDWNAKPIDREYCVIFASHENDVHMTSLDTIIQQMKIGYKIRPVTVDMLLSALPPLLHEKQQGQWLKQPLTPEEYSRMKPKSDSPLCSLSYRLPCLHGTTYAPLHCRGRIEDIYALMSVYPIRDDSLADLGNGVAAAIVRRADMAIFKRFPNLRFTGFGFHENTGYVLYSESGYGEITDVKKHFAREDESYGVGNDFIYDVMKYHRSVGILYEHTNEIRYVHYFFPFKEQWADDRYFIQEPDGQFYLESPVKSAE